MGAFYKCRVQEDVTEKLILPSKGSVKKISNNEIDKKTNGPFLIQLCYNVRALPTVAIEPTITQVQNEVDIIMPPSIYSIKDVNINLFVEQVNKEWVSRAFDNFGIYNNYFKFG